MVVKQRNIDVGKIKKVAEVLKVIGHPIRLKVLEILENEVSLSVSEIQNRLEIPTEQSLLSHHLIKMKDKGILSCEKQGMNVMYSVTNKGILGIFDCFEKHS